MRLDRHITLCGRQRAVTVPARVPEEDRRCSRPSTSRSEPGRVGCTLGRRRGHSRLGAPNYIFLAHTKVSAYLGILQFIVRESLVGSR